MPDADDRTYTYDASCPATPFVCKICPKKCRTEGGHNLHYRKTHTEAGRIPTTGERKGVPPGPGPAADGAARAPCSHDWILIDPGRSDEEARAWEAGYSRVCRLCVEVEK